MEPVIIGIIGVIILIILLFSGLPIGVGMALVGVLGFAYLTDMDAALGILRTVPYATFASNSLSVIPLFILMGAFAMSSGMSEALFRAVYRWLGHMKGGVAQATIAACACFAAISGSSLATAVTLGSVALPEMRKYRYDDALATGAVAAGGSMGILIPPSVILIIYGIITEQSIGKLFLAGFIPGMMEMVFYMITVWLLTTIKPELGPKGPKAGFREKMNALGHTWDVILLFIVVIGGIYAGVFTPTEAAGIGAFGTFFIALVRKRLTWGVFKESLSTTLVTTGMLFLIMMGAMIFGYFLSVSQLPTEMAAFVGGLSVNRYIILAVILIIVLMLGCIMDSMAIVLLTIPVFYPLVIDLGFNPIWFGILVVRVTEMGMITPPVGMNVFVIKGISDVPIGTIFRGIMPFLMADTLQVILLILFPQIVLFIPNLMS